MRIPLGTTDQRRSLAQVPAVQVKNRFFESDPTNQKDQVALLARPGLRKWLEVGDGPIRGIYSQPGAFDEALFVVSGGNLYSIATDETVTLIGALGTSTGSVSMAATDFPHKLYIADGNSLKLWDGTDLTTVAVPDDDGIVSVGFIAQYVICVVAQGFDKNGRFYWIQPGETEIDPLDFATAERAPDPVWSVVVVGDQFWLPGTSTTEVWYPTGTAEAPFLRQQGRLFDKGVWEGTIIQVKDEMMAVGTDGNVYRIGAEPVKVGNASICQRLREAIGKQKKARAATTPPAPETPLPVVSIAGPGSVAESDSGSTAATFTLSRTGDLSRTSSVLVTVSGNGSDPANAADFGGAFQSGTVSFAAGESSKAFVANISGDATVEVGEGFKAVLTAAVGCTIGTGTATGTIANDDTAPDGGGGGEEPAEDGWATLALGPWGFVTDLDFSADGLAATARTDVGGGYYAEAPDFVWRQVITPTTLPAPATDYYGEDNPSSSGGFADADGMYGLTIAPSDKTRLYGTYAGYLFRSDDKGLSWVETSLPRQLMKCNELEARKYNPRLAVDPLNPDVAYFAGMTSGVWQTLDAGETWTEVFTTTPTPQDGQQWALVAIDHSSASTSSGATLRKSRVLVFSRGRGLYESATGGGSGSFSLLTSTPVDVTQLVIDAVGAVYMPQLDGTLRRWEGSLSTIPYPGDAYTIAVDPANNNRLVCLEGNSGSSVSVNDRGATWRAMRNSFPNQNNPNSNLLASERFPYFSVTNTFGLAAGLKFRPGATNEVWAPMGIGIVRCNYPDADLSLETRPVWNEVSEGIEELVTRHCLSPIGHPPLILCHDRAIFRVTDPDSHPALYGPNSDFAHGASADQAKDDPTYIAALCYSNIAGGRSAYSEDGGESWTQFASEPALTQGGSMAVGAAGNIVIADGNNGPLRYTTDNGVNWTSVTPTGVPSSGERGWGFGGIPIDRQIVCNDGTHFYAYNYGAPGAEAASQGIWRSATGASWTRVNSTTVALFATYHSTLANPCGYTGHLFLSAGDVGGAENPAGTDFMFSNDGGATFNAIAGFKEVKHFGFGKEATEGAYRAIYALGYYNDVLSVWRCIDFDPATRAGTWTDLGRPSTVQFVTFVKGDYNLYGRVFFGTKCGAFYGDFA